MNLFLFVAFRASLIEATTSRFSMQGSFRGFVKRQLKILCENIQYGAPKQEIRMVRGQQVLTFYGR